MDRLAQLTALRLGDSATGATGESFLLAEETHVVELDPSLRAIRRDQEQGADRVAWREMQAHLVRELDPIGVEQPVIDERNAEAPGFLMPQSSPLPVVELETAPSQEQLRARRHPETHLDL